MLQGGSRTSCTYPESTVEFALARPRDAQCATVEVFDQPVAFQRARQQRGSERPADMRSPLTPVDTCIGETPPQRPQRRDIYSQS
jgi:hypothetical protein